MKRGALIVLEGCDRAGKSTQVKRLVEALNDLGIKAEARRFPDRTTVIGSVINDYLTHKNDLPRETIHLLFSANRWECSDDVIEKLNSSTTIVVDRYAASGAAYAAASTQRPISWCKEPDRGLSAPDFVAFLSVNNDSLSTRNGWANERFENEEFQEQVAKNFLELQEDTWKTIAADQSIDDVHKVLLEESLNVIKNIGEKPIGKLYEK